MSPSSRSTRTPAWSGSAAARAATPTRCRARSLPAAHTRPTHRQAALLALGERVRDAGLARIGDRDACIDLLRGVRPAPARRRSAAHRRPGRPRRARRSGRCARRFGALHPGPARLGQDLHRRPARRRADAPRQARRRRRDLTQGDLQAARGDRRARPTRLGRPFAGMQKCDAESDSAVRSSHIAVTNNVSELASVGAETYSCSRGRRGCGRAQDMRAKVDVLFIDEAGQVSLADALAMAQARAASSCSATRSSSRTSARARTRAARARRSWSTCSGERDTVPRDRGVFLDRTWRMHPDVCQFVSDDDVRRSPEADRWARAPAHRLAGAVAARVCGCSGWSTRQPPGLGEEAERDRTRVRPAARRRDLDRQTRRRAPADARRHPRRRAVQRPGALPESQAPRRALVSAPSTSSRARRRRSSSSR